MARLTQTRPGTGSTMLRAMHGLTKRLEYTPYTVELLEIKPEDILDLPFPILTPIHYEPTQLHMVTIISADRMSVCVVDPVEGTMNMTWDTVRQVFGGQVLVFVRR